MKVTLNHAEITAAAIAYIAGQGIGLEGKTVEVDFTMGRGADPLSAVVSIESAPVASVPLLEPEVQRPVLSVVTNTPVLANQPQDGEANTAGDNSSDAADAAAATVIEGAKKSSLFS